MKKIYLLILLFGSTTLAFAECDWEGMSFLPRTTEISLHSKFIIEGYADSRAIVNTLKDRKIFLESESGDLIELVFEEIHFGQMLVNQVVFAPKTKLRPNTKYHLKYEGQNANEERHMWRYNSEKQENEKVYWRTTEMIRIDDLNPKMTINFKEVSVVEYGCGWSENAVFKVLNKNMQEIWFKTEVLNLSDSTKTTYYLSERAGEIEVGHGMCSGAFTFKNEGDYKVRFTPMNIEGKALAMSRWFTFKKPE